MPEFFDKFAQKLSASFDQLKTATTEIESEDLLFPPHYTILSQKVDQVHAFHLTFLRVAKQLSAINLYDSSLKETFQNALHTMKELPISKPNPLDFKETFVKLQDKKSVQHVMAGQCMIASRLLDDELRFPNSNVCSKTLKVYGLVAEKMAISEQIMYEKIENEVIAPMNDIISSFAEIEKFRQRASASQIDLQSLLKSMDLNSATIDAARTTFKQAYDDAYNEMCNFMENTSLEACVKNLALCQLQHYQRAAEQLSLLNEN